MDIQELEVRSQNLNTKLKSEKSPRTTLFYLNDFLNYLISIDDNSMYECYLISHISQYIHLIKSFTPIGIEPEYVNEILSSAKALLNIKMFEQYRGSLSNAINELEKKNIFLHNILEGNNLDQEINDTGSVAFPVSEKHSFDNKYFGMIEHITIILRKESRKGEDVITVIPSQENLEKRLSNQILTSWKLAKEFCKKYIHKFYPRHEIIIRFSEKFGNYVGESLGVALTIGFVQEIHKLYNLPTDININNLAVFTGGIDKNGHVKSVSTKIIEIKTGTVFFSPSKLFAIPKYDETAARNKLSELNNKYPNRKLKVIPIEDISDLFNRRDLVNIEKQSLIKRSSKALKKRGVTLTLLLILLGIFSFNLLKYLDSNPTKLIDNKGELVVENKYGRTLFTKQIAYKSLIPKATGETKYFRRLIDVDNDGTNELLLIYEKLNNRNQNKTEGRLACFNNHGKLIWSYLFSAKVKTKRESFTSDYRFERILGITKRNGKKTIYAAARHSEFYPTAIVSLDAGTGKRVGDIFWHPGSITFGAIGDFNKDHIPEIILFGINNGMERSALMSINLDELNGRAPSKPAYSFIGYPIAKFNKYVLVPKSDYCAYFKNRFNVPGGLGFQYKVNKLFFILRENRNINISTALGYYVDKNLLNPELILGDDFQVRRDSLVVHGKLNPPLTNTKEYEAILLSQFEEWDAKTGKFVKMVKK